MTTLPYHYRRGPPRARKTRAEPELALQVSVKQFLVMCLPDDVEWTSSLAGAHLGPSQRAKMKASGLRPGFPDFVFIIRRRAFWIELKAPSDVVSDRRGTIRDPDLSGDQARVLGALHPDSWAICRTVEDVVGALTRWGVTLRNHSF